jgi:glycine oxidase
MVLRSPPVESFDVAIVGGGSIGCAIALRLAKAGAQVCVIEKCFPGAEASSAAAGILAPQAESHGQGPFLDLCLRSGALYPAFALELQQDTGIDVGYVQSGLLEIATDAAAAEALASRAAWQRARGLAAEIQTPDQARKREPALQGPLVAALHFPNDHQIESRLLVRALYAAASSAGARFTTAFVRGVLVEKSRAAGVVTNAGPIGAGSVVIAAGAWSEGITAASAHVEPSRGQMVEFSLKQPIFRSVIMGAGGYVVPRTDGRVIAGSTDERVGFDRSPTPAGIERILGIAAALVPALRDAPVSSVWTGFRPASRDGLPLLGETDVPGLLAATGHYRNGILLTPITASAISDLVIGRSPEVDLAPFSPRR